MDELAGSKGKDLGNGSRKHRITINRDRTRDYDSAVALNNKQASEKKYNIKLLHHDYEIIKMVSVMEGKSASYFVSFLIYDYVYRQLGDMVGDSTDALLLIGATADATTDFDRLLTPWIYDIMSKDITEIVGKVTGNSDADLEPLMSLLKKYEKNNSYLYDVVKLAIES